MEPHLIITIGRQLGAGGLGVARRLAEEFGLKVYDKELLAEVARESGLDEACFEKRDEKSSRGVLGAALQGFRSLFGVYNRAGADSVMNEDKLFQIQSEVMRGIAAREDCIFVGRCADYILRDEPRLVTVFIAADLESRVRNLMRVSETERKPEVAASPRGEALFRCARRSGVPRGPATSTGSLASQRHPGKFPKVPGRRRGTRGFPAAPRQRPRESFFNASRGPNPLA